MTLGPRETIAQESITGRLLIDLGINDPDYLPTIMGEVATQEAPVLSLLDMKGLKTKGLNYTTNANFDNGRFTTVSSSHVQYRIAQNDYRKEHFRANVNGLTFISDANPTKPGLQGQPFYIFLDSNVIGGKDIILLADGKTQLWVDNERGGEEKAGGVFMFKVKIIGAEDDIYVDPNIMQDGFECQLVGALHEQDFSEFGNERYSMGTFGDAYLSLFRLKYSWSGTAAAMDKNRKIDGRKVVVGNDKNNWSFLRYADEEMLKWAARFSNWQLLEGKSTVNRDTKKIKLTDERNKEILAGDGIMNCGDGPIEYPQGSGWTKKWLETFMTDINSYVNYDETGEKSVAVLLPSRSYVEFNILMGSLGVTKDVNIVGEGGQKIQNNTYLGYNLAGVTLYVHEYKSLTARPGLPLNDGTKSNDYDGLVIPMGKTASGDPGIQLIQLRPMVRGKLAGLDQGGNICSSVDGSSEHLLVQNGVVSQNKVFKIYRPYMNSLL